MTDTQQIVCLWRDDEYTLCPDLHDDLTTIFVVLILISTRFFILSPDDEFIDMQTCFMMENCHEFENSEENKLIYMDIYSKYVRLNFSLSDSFWFLAIILPITPIEGRMFSFHRVLFFFLNFLRLI